MIAASRLPMSSFLLRLLLLAVFFNTALGMPMHDAKHLQQVGPGSVQAGNSSTDEDITTPEHGDEIHDACAWCQAFGQQATALPAAAISLADRSDRTDRRPPPGLAAFVPSPGRWCFAARDPPTVS